MPKKEKQRKNIAIVRSSHAFVYVLCSRRRRRFRSLRRTRRLLHITGLALVTSALITGLALVAAPPNILNMK